MALPDDTLPGDDATAASGDAAVVVALLAEIVALRSENAVLLGRLAELERRLGLNSSNSGKLPRSDGPVVRFTKQRKSPPLLDGLPLQSAPDVSPAAIHRPRVASGSR